MTSFRKLSPNTIQNDSGSSLQILGRTGIRVDVDGQTYTIDSEMLASPMSIVLYRNSISPEAGASVDMIFEFACNALQWAGFTVETT